jgi:hypothetical protein
MWELWRTLWVSSSDLIQLSAPSLFGACTVELLVANVLSGLSLTSSHVTLRKDSLGSFISFHIVAYGYDRLCGLLNRVLGYRSGGPGSIPGTTRKKVVDLERGPLSLVSTTEELLDRKVVAAV